MCGEDVCIDVGTGCGKSLCFVLPLLLHEEDIALVISPLSALMLDQVRSCPLPSIAVCKETLQAKGSAKLYEEISQGTYRLVYVSPEILDSKEFRTGVLAKAGFYEHLRVTFVDEAHCISHWGGSFRPDYATLGSLRGRLPVNMPIAVASATLPDHIMDDIRANLQLDPDAAVIAVTNARPNIALSVRPLKHPIRTKADLRFLIPRDVRAPEDIPISLVYCNSRTEVEDIADVVRQWLPKSPVEQGSQEWGDCVAFYHAKVGERRKRELENKLRQGVVRILICTDAVGMGCDMRNIKRVILWGLPPSFCALVQRAGRAVRDMAQFGEAILFVPAKMIKAGVLLDDVVNGVREAVVAAEAANRDEVGTIQGDQDLADAADPGIELAGGHQRLLVNEGGVRIETMVESGDDEAVDDAVGASSSHRGTRGPGGKPAGKKKRTQECNAIEARYLSRFTTTKTCRRVVWDLFFKNSHKLPLNASTSTYTANTPPPRCCDNCNASLFPVEAITVEKDRRALKRGRKREFPPMLRDTIRSSLKSWRSNRLRKKLYPNSKALITGDALLGDEIIEQLVTCGERISNVTQLAGRTRWAFAYNFDGSLSDIGADLLAVLDAAYKSYDEQDAAEQTRRLERGSISSAPPISTAHFYASSSSSNVRGRKEAPYTVDKNVESSDEEPLCKQYNRQE